MGSLVSQVGAGPQTDCRSDVRLADGRARAAPAAAARRTLVAQKSGSSLLPAWMKELRETHQRQHSTRSAAGPPPGLTRSRWAALRTAPAVLPAVDPSSSSHLRRTGSTGEELARSSLPASTQSSRGCFRVDQSWVGFLFPLSAAQFVVSAVGLALGFAVFR